MREELRKARKAAGLTQGQVALAAGIDRTAYNRIERGTQKPPVDVAVRIARVLRKPVEEIFLPTAVHLEHSQDEPDEQAATSESA